MVSDGVSKLGYTNSIFVDPGVKVNGAYYHDIDMICCCHNSCCLPNVRSLAFLISEFLIVQQDSASVHRARETFNLLRRKTPAFISLDLWSPNNPDHCPVDYQIRGISESRQKCTECGPFEASSD